MTLIRIQTLLASLCTAAIVAGCATPPGNTSRSSGASSPGKAYTASKPGGYYLDDGPEASPPDGLDATPDPIPRVEPLASGANRPYTQFGKRYVPNTSDKPFRQEGRASWYGKKFHGKRTANGERYDMYAMTAAHPTLPIPSYARVTNPENGRSVIVRINDRGPFHGKRIIDVSYTAAVRLDLIHHGHGPVVVERITTEEIAALGRQQPAAAAAKPQAVAMAGASAAALPAPAPAQAGGQDDAFYLQMGAFNEPNNAQKLASRINTQLKQGTKTLPPAVIEQGDQLYRVKIGPYTDRQDALGAVQTVADLTGILPSLTNR